MTEIKDSLLTALAPDRVSYETGILLNAEDFQAEQDYHRGRLAKALSYVIGSGTVAGLKLNHRPKVAKEDDPEGLGEEERLLLDPGLAIDPLGRLIEIPRHLCFRLNRWYENQNDQDLREGFKAADTAWPGSPQGVVLDLFLSFIACERGKTPSFAVGPTDSLDAVSSSRVRDGYDAHLVIRKEANPPLPVSPWADLSSIADLGERGLALRNAIFNAWKTTSPVTTAVFIARVVIVSTLGEGESRPLRDEAKTIAINNKDRLFVMTGQALASWFGVNSNLGNEE